MGIASSCMTAPPCSGCLPEGLYGRRTPLPPSIRLSPWGVRIAGRFLASAVLRSGRALRGYWRGLPRRTKETDDTSDEYDGSPVGQAYRTGAAPCSLKFAKKVVKNTAIE